MPFLDYLVTEINGKLVVPQGIHTSGESSSVLRLDLVFNMHIFVLRGLVFPIVLKLGKQFNIRMLARLTLVT